MIVADIEADDPRPVRWNTERVFTYDIFGDGEDPPGAEDRNAFRPRLALMLGIQSLHAESFLGAEMLRISQFHHHDGRTGLFVDQKAFHHVAHT